MALLDAGRVYLRNFCREDIHDMYEFCSQREIEMVGWSAHENMDQTRKVLEQWISDQNIYAIVHKSENKVIGYIAVHEDSEEGRSDTKELGFALNRRYHRQGIMSEVVRCVLGDLFSEEKDIFYVWACCIQDNIPSKNLIEKTGFELVQEGVFFAASFHGEVPSYEYRMSKSDWRARS